MTSNPLSETANRTPARAMLLPVLLSLCAGTALAQKATEVYIPIGQSVGLSGTHTLLGRVQQVDAAARRLTLRSDEGAATTVRVAEETSLWLDRSGLRQRSGIASLADLQAGRRIEIKLRGNDRAAGVAEWIKIEAAP